ncbi:preprotein translocase, SecE subunit [Solidesulfovibrio carbinoliphilus subsp. oakridgensis]|uniref:Protein translocase subunit SecE n=1 Tax=Solidesulfovibrio carbinoliphilus subsp. oakridgensis TaxID=694327 RepID=G7QCZ9_9BACT|nr:preprotein translocase subunit SecE [Solidesulfovibrio carbinoliphilus]EHJ46305.1 preprotein translocase, SecE subunit [Solidesulfovibrio carbinoliphilus subsp. oakridgensis]
MAKEKTQAVAAADKPVKAKPAACKAGTKSADGAAGSDKSLKARIDAGREFFEQSKVELKKVTWPTRQETVKTGIAVLVFSVVMAIYLGVVDMALSRLVAFILS